MKTMRSKTLWSALLALVMLLSLLPVSALADEVEGAEAAPVNEAGEVALDGGYGAGVTGVQTMQLGSFALTFTSGSPVLGDYGYYYIDTDNNKIKMASDGKLNCDVTMTVGSSSNSVTLRGSTNAEFTFDTETIGEKTFITITAPAGATVTRVGHEAIKCVTAAKIGFVDGDVLWLLEGSITTVAGRGALEVKVPDGDTASHCIALSASNEENFTIQKNGGAVSVKAAIGGETFYVDGKPYESETNDYVFTVGGNSDDDSGTDDSGSGNDSKDAATDTKPKGDKVAKTGDESSVALWIAVMLGAGSALCVAVVLGKKKKD